MASSPDAVPVDEIESLLTCSICLETLNDPRTLPCFHSFCKCCLETFVKKQREKVVGKEIKDFNCPTCRSVFTLEPSEEVEGMSGSHFIRNMLDVMAIQRRAKVAKCSHCENSATCRCVTCDIFMCEKCFEAHESWPGFMKHKILTINELTQPENQGKMRGTLHCKEHKDKKLKFYCETCKELICRYCMDFNHVKPDHSCLPVENVAEKQKEALVSSFGILNGKLMQGNEALQAISNARKTLEEDAKKAKDKIIKEKEEILEKLEERARVKVNEVDEAYNEINEKLSKEETEMKSFLERMKGSVALSQNLLERGTNEEIISSQKMIEGSVEKSQKEFPERVKPTAYSCIQYIRLPMDDGHIVELLNALGTVEKTSCPQQLQSGIREFPTLGCGNSGARLPEGRALLLPFGQPPRIMSPPPPGVVYHGPPQRGGYESQEGSRGFGVPVRVASPSPVGQQTGNKPRFVVGPMCNSEKHGAGGARYRGSWRGGSALRRGGGRDPRRSCGVGFDFDEFDDETFRKQDDGLKVRRGGGGRSQPSGTRSSRGVPRF